MDTKRINFNNDQEVIGLVERFESRTLPRSEWTHAAHLTVALFYCARHPIGVARNLMRDGIHWLNDAHGTVNSDEGGYHETLTRFWMAAVNDFLHTRPRGELLYSIANGLMDELGDPELPLRYYSRELLFGTEARRFYVPPDLNASRSAIP